MFKSFAVTSLLAAAAMAAEGEFNYKTLGADWGSINPVCDTGREQSPIDL